MTFKNALNKPKLNLQVAASKPLAAFKQIMQEESPDPVPVVGGSPRIERVLNKQRIDVIFIINEPNQNLKEKLRLAGAKERITQDREQWVFELADTFDNRVWLEYNFQADFGDHEPKQTADQSPHTPPEPESKPEPTPEPAQKPSPKPAGEVLEAPYEPLPVLARYRQQVDELIAILDLRPADLILVAIDHLHAAKCRTH